MHQWDSNLVIQKSKRQFTTIANVIRICPSLNVVNFRKAVKRFNRDYQRSDLNTKVPNE